MPTIRDVAKLAGVSVATVSRVINDSAAVTKETRDAVMSCMDKLHYSPNSIARALTSKSTRTLGLIIPDVQNPFFSAIARAVADTAEQYGYTVFLCNSDGDADHEINYLRSLKTRYVDGLIIATRQVNLRETRGLKKSGIGMVFLDRAVEADSAYSVKVDHYQGALLAVRHLLAVGCRKIAHISGPLFLNTAHERYKGYEFLMKQADAFDPSLVLEGDFTVAKGFELTDRLMKSNPDVDGIFAANDLTAIGALKALLRLGKRVPAEVALIGYDGIEMARVMEPEISTIAQPIYEIGATAVHKLMAQINPGRSRDFREQLEPQLICRASTQR